MFFRWDQAVRLKAMDVLGTFGPVAKPAIPDLAIELKSPDRNTSEHAAVALANIDPSNKKVLLILRSMLNKCCETGNAIYAVGDMGTNAQSATLVLKQMLATDEQPSERQAAVTALARIEGINAVPALEHVMSSDKDDSVRTTAVTALAGLRSDSPRAISPLVGTLSDDSEAVRDAASEALSKMGRSAVPALITALKSPHLYPRAWSVQTLSRIKPLPDDAAHALALASNDKSEIVGGEAADALKGDKVDAGDVIRERQMTVDIDLPEVGAEEYHLFERDQTPQNARRYTRTEILAPIPPDPNHEYRAVLEYLVPVPSHSSAPNAKFLVTVHEAKEARIV
jgi:HEAT repeat protein